jgi:hypothetical protein
LRHESGSYEVETRANASTFNLAEIDFIVRCIDPKFTLTESLHAQDNVYFLGESNECGVSEALAGNNVVEFEPLERERFNEDTLASIISTCSRTVSTVNENWSIGVF